MLKHTPRTNNIMAQLATTRHVLVVKCSLHDGRGLARREEGNSNITLTVSLIVFFFFYQNPIGQNIIQEECLLSL